MNWLSRLFGREEKRALTNLPFDRGGYNPTEINTTKALGLVPVWACIRIITDSVSSLPLQAYRKGSDGTTVPMNSLPQLIYSPSSVASRQTWVKQALMSLLLRGNAYGLITARDGFGYPTAIEWLSPDEIFVDDTRPSMPVYYWHKRAIPATDIVHIPWLPQFGSVVGISPISAFANTIGIGLETTQYSQSWFENGGTPPATMQSTEYSVTPEEAEEVSDQLTKFIRRRKPLVFGKEWAYTPIRVSPEESQFIQTSKLNATQIAAIFGVPPEKVGGEAGHSMRYTSAEQDQIDFVQFTLRPWLVLLENAISDLLPDRQYVKFNADALVRADIKTRYDAHHLAVTDGWMSKDEVRALEDLDPLPNGEGAKYGQPIQPPASHFSPTLNGNGVPSLVNGSHK